MLITACSDSADSSFLTCSDLAAEWYRTEAAELSEAPSFGAGEIASGEPITLAVPVNEFAQKVRVRIRSVTDPDVAVSVPSLDTRGNETVLFALADTNVPAGVYLLRSVFLTGPDLGGNSSYSADEAEARYVLTATPGPEVAVQCLTAIPAATFVVRDNTSK